MTEQEILAVLKAAFKHCPEDVADVLRRLQIAQEQVDGLTSAQKSGPDTVPESVDRAWADYRESLKDLAGNVAFYTRPTLTVDVRDVRRGPVDYILITLVGHLDEATAPQVREAVKNARTADGYRSIAIDLTKATVHGRKGLSPLVNAFFCAKHLADGEFYLIAGSKMERRVLGQISGGSLRTFSTVAELDEALDAETRAGVR